MELTLGQHLKGYELRERLAVGGFGAVYRAYQTGVGRDVAIKVILPNVASQPDFIRRFETEAQIIARLEHLHIVPLYDYWRDPDGAYLVMRWLKGGSLRDSLAHGAFELEAAHRSGVIHRDLKPANIFLDEDGNAYLSDFGIAKDLTNPTGGSTADDVILGTLDYISPEQARSEPITPRTDIYSFGVVLYEVLTGLHPFPNITSVERLYKHLNEPLPSVPASASAPRSPAPTAPAAPVPGSVAVPVAGRTAFLLPVPLAISPDASSTGPPVSAAPSPFPVDRHPLPPGSADCIPR